MFAQMGGNNTKFSRILAPSPRVMTFSAAGFVSPILRDAASLAADLSMLCVAAGDGVADGTAGAGATVAWLLPG